MNIKKKSKGTLEQMLQAFENKINELEGIDAETSIDAADGLDADGNTGRWAQLDLNAEDGYKYSGNGGRSWVSVDSDAIDVWPSKEAAIEDGKSSFKRNYKYGRDWDVVNIDDVVDIESATQIDEIDECIDADIQDSFQIGDAVMRIDDREPGEIIEKDIEADEYLVAFDNGEEEWVHMIDLQLVDDNTIESATTITSKDIKAADEIADIDYLDELVERIEDALYDKGYRADQILVENDGVGYITVNVSVSDDTPDVLYMISIDDIEPIWEDIIKDSEFIADAVVDQVVEETGSDGIVAAKQITASVDDIDRHIKDLIKLGFYKTKEYRYHYDINENYGAEYYPNDEFGGFIYDKNTNLDVEHDLSIPQMVKAINEYKSK